MWHAPAISRFLLFSIFSLVQVTHLPPTYFQSLTCFLVSSLVLAGVSLLHCRKSDSLENTRCFPFLFRPCKGPPLVWDFWYLSDHVPFSSIPPQLHHSLVCQKRKINTGLRSTETYYVSFASCPAGLPKHRLLEQFTSTYGSFVLIIPTWTWSLRWGVPSELLSALVLNPWELRLNFLILCCSISPPSWDVSTWNTHAASYIFVV